MSFSNIPKDRLQGKTIFITGATGFIGCRLAEVLALEFGSTVRCLVRDFGKAYRLARLPIEMVQGDLLDTDAVVKASQNCSYVFHCAYGNKGDQALRRKTNIDGTRNVLDAAHTSGVICTVILSTVSVYGIQRAGAVAEDLPRNAKRDPYAQSKIEMEHLIHDYRKRVRLNSVILQPTAVYGPWAVSYGTKLIKQLQSSVLPVIDGKEGTCNAVFIDDLVEAMLLAATTEAGYNQSYIINGPEYISWKSFFAYFGSMIHEATVRETSKTAYNTFLARVRRTNGLFGSVLRSIKVDRNAIKSLSRFKVYRFVLALLRIVVPSRIYTKVTNSLSPTTQAPFGGNTTVKPFMVLDAETRRLYQSEAKTSSLKAQQILNYKPSYGFGRGFDITSKWYDWFYGRLES